MILMISTMTWSCGSVEKAQKEEYREGIAGAWSTSCAKVDDTRSERHSLTIDDDDAFQFTTRRFADTDCEALDLQIDYQGTYKVGGFVLRKGESGRTVTMDFKTRALTPAADGDGDVGPFHVGSVHRVIFKRDRGDDEMTEYATNGDVLRRYTKD